MNHLLFEINEQLTTISADFNNINCNLHRALSANDTQTLVAMIKKYYDLVAIMSQFGQQLTQSQPFLFDQQVKKQGFAKMELDLEEAESFVRLEALKKNILSSVKEVFAVTQKVDQQIQTFFSQKSLQLFIDGLDNSKKVFFVNEMIEILKRFLGVGENFVQFLTNETGKELYNETKNNASKLEGFADSLSKEKNLQKEWNQEMEDKLLILAWLIKQRNDLQAI